jgi:hypothetical protein
VASLQELQDQRAFECRQRPDRALETLDEAAEWLGERGLVTLTPSRSLPSLFEACQEEPYMPEKSGFAQWPKTKYWWPFALGLRDDVITTKLHRGKTLLLSRETAALADPICRAELVRMEDADPEWARLLRHLSAAGPSQPQDLQTELGLRPRDLKALRYPLERCGAIVARRVEAGEDNWTTELARWDQVIDEPAEEGGLDELLVAAVRAAVVAPERELTRWFPWPWYWEEGLVDRLAEDARLYRPEHGWIAAT